MTKVTFKDRQFHARKESYCENCGNFDGDWNIGVPNGVKIEGKNNNCKKCRYLAPSMFVLISPNPEPEVKISDQEIIDQHHRMKYGEY